uniref:Zinc finger protein 26 n=1 Tax=Cacopsylla melanoneura TaxID=428564 RepID=A0A8D9DQA0_9HEMI
MKNIIPLIEECCLCMERHKIKNCNILNSPHIVNDTSTPCKAYATLPSILSVEKTCDGKEMVKTKSFLSKGVRFGPVDSQSTDKVPVDTDFPLKLLFDVDKFTYLDTRDKTACNWMCLVQPATCFQECNLVAYQSEFRIYFSVLRNIDVNTELRVYYAPFYAEKMCVQFSRNNIPSITEDYDDMFDDHLGDSPDLDPDHMMEGINQMSNPSPTPTPNITSNDSNNLNSSPVRSSQPVEDQSEWNCSMCDSVIISTPLFAEHLREHYNSKDFLENEAADKAAPPPLVSNPNETLSTLQSSALLLSETGEGFTVNCGPTLGLNSLTTTSVPTTLNLGDELQVMSDLNLSYMNILPSVPILYLNTTTAKPMTVSNDLAESKPKKVFTCDICGKKFAKVMYIKRHLKQHEGEFHCARCNKNYTRKESLQLHECVNMVYNCTQCEQTFTKIKLFKQHRSTHKRQTAKFTLESLTCFQCSHVSDTMANFIQHIRTHFDKNKVNLSMIQCPICNQSYTRCRVFYTKHLRSHEASEYCALCKGVFHNRKTYEKHWCLNPDTRELPNQIQLKTKSNPLLRRNKQHANEDEEDTSGIIDSSARFTCDICLMNFTNEIKFRLHKKEHEEAMVTQATSVLCDHCGKSYDNATSLSKHITKMHNTNNNNKIQCAEPSCGKQFDTSRQLLLHIQRHKDSNITYNTPDNYPCTFCDKVFTLKKYRTIHISIKHTTDYKYSCSLCGDKFKIKQYLNSHVKHVHDNVPKVRPMKYRYGCHMCKRKFVRKKILRKHIASHSTVVSYACKLCPKTTIREKFMMNHLERVHQDKRAEWNREGYLKKLVTVKVVDRINMDEEDINGIDQEDNLNINHLHTNGISEEDNLNHHQHMNGMTLENQNTNYVNVNIHETNQQHLPTTSLEHIENQQAVLSVLDHENNLEHEDNLLNDDPMKLFDLNPESNSATALLRQGRELPGDTISNFDLSVFCNEQSVDSSLYTQPAQFNTQSTQFHIQPAHGTSTQPAQFNTQPTQFNTQPTQSEHGIQTTQYTQFNSQPMTTSYSINVQPTTQPMTSSYTINVQPTTLSSTNTLSEPAVSSYTTFSSAHTVNVQPTSSSTNTRSVNSQLLSSISSTNTANSEPAVSSYTTFTSANSVNVQPTFSSTNTPSVNSQPISSYTTLLNAETSYHKVSKETAVPATSTAASTVLPFHSNVPETVVPATSTTASTVLPASNVLSLLPIPSNQYCLTDNSSLPLQTIQTSDIRISAPVLNNLPVPDGGNNLGGEQFMYVILDPTSSTGANVVTMDFDIRL